jgi:hypothetical protein
MNVLALWGRGELSKKLPHLNVHHCQPVQTFFAENFLNTVMSVLCNQNIEFILDYLSSKCNKITIIRLTAKLLQLSTR